MLPVVNPFDLMQERRMSSRRTSTTSAAVPAAGTEGPAAEEPKELAEAMPIMAAIERDRQTKLKNATKTGDHTSGPRKSTEPRIPVDARIREYPGQGFAKVLGKLRCKCYKNGPVPGTVRLYALLRHLSGTPALRPVVRFRARGGN